MALHHLKSHFIHNILFDPNHNPTKQPERYYPDFSSYITHTYPRGLTEKLKN